MMKSILFFYTALLFIVAFPCRAQQSATIFATKSPQEMYLAGVLDKKTVNEDNHVVLDLIDDNITMSFTGIAAKSTTFHSDKDQMDRAIKEVIKTLGENVFQNSSSFSYNLQELDSYNAIQNYFGQAIDNNKWFGIADGKNKPKTLLALDISRVAFSLALDLPQNGQFEMNTDLEEYKLDDLIYVNSLSFGRRIIVLIESNIEKAKVLQAIKTVIEGAKMSAEDRAILANCTFTSINFGAQEISMKAESPFSNILQYMNAEIKAENYGTPISFGASYMKDNSVFENQY